MPRIPLATANRAPRPAAPVLNDTNRRGYGVSPSVRTLMTPTISRGALDGNARGLQQLGQGVATLAPAGNAVANAVADFQKVKAEIADVKADAEADAMMTEYIASREAENVNLPADQWEGNFAQKSDELRRSINALPMSEGMRQRMETKQQTWLKTQGARIRTAATKQGFAEARDAVITTSRIDFEKGNYEAAFTRLAEAKAKGLLSESQYEAEKFAGQKLVNGQMQAQMLATDPVAYQDEMDELVKTGKSKAFPHLDGNYDEALRQQGIARTAVNNIRVTAINEARELMAGGGLQTDADLEAYNRDKGQGTLTANDLKALKSFGLTTRPPDYAAQAEYRPKVLAYDASADPDGSEKVKLLRELQESGMNKQQVDMLVSDLDASERDTSPGRKVKAAGHDQIDRFLKDGLWGPIETPEKGKALAKEKIQANSNIYKSAIEMGRLFDEHMRANPNMSEADAMNWLNEQALAQAETQKGSSWFNFTPTVMAVRAYFNATQPKKAAPTAADILDKTQK